MDAVIASIATATSEIGFPLVAVGAMFWMLNKQQDQNRQDSEKWAEAVNNNTAAITRLCEKLEARQ